MKYLILITTMVIAPLSASADDKVKTAIGGGVGGAVGAVIGEELGDKEGAIVGAGVGAAIGAALATDEDSGRRNEARRETVVVHVDGPPAHGKHCPPGQAKKGRC